MSSFAVTPESTFIETFSTGIQLSNLKDSKLISDLLKYAFEVRQKHPKGTVNSNILGYQSPTLEDEILKQMMQKMHADIEKYLINLKFSTPFEIHYDSPWINISGKYHSNKEHHHGNADFSAVCWMQVNQDTGGIVFKNPNPTHSMRKVWLSKFDEYKACNSGEYTYYPDCGDFAIFPGDLKHEVQPNKSDQERVSIAYNFNVVQKNTLTSK